MQLLLVAVAALRIGTGKAAGDPVWVRVAAADSRVEARTAADIVCSGTNDEMTIQQAIDLCRENGKQLFLFSGLYRLGAVKDFGDGGPRASVCIGNMHREFAVIGERRQLTGWPTNMTANGVVFYLQPEALQAAEGLSVDIFRGEWSRVGIMNGSGLRMENIAVFAPDSQHPLRAIDFRRVNSVELRNVQLSAFGTAILKMGLRYPYGDPPPPHPENIGITLTDGSNNAPVNLLNVTACGFGQGFQVGGEHVVMVNCSAVFGGYGFTFGNYPYNCAFNHPITLVNCCDEQNIHLPLFNSCGDNGGELHGRQEVTMISFNCERVAEHAPGKRLGDLMREVRPGTWCGNIGFTRQPKWNAVNSVDEPIWAENGSGAGFVTRNNAHKSACGTSERISYYPQYMQQVYDTDLNKLLICTDPAKRVWRDALGAVVDDGEVVQVKKARGIDDKGWYADPQIRYFDNAYWIFPTASRPFAEQTYLDAFSSPDLLTWKRHSCILTTNEITWARGCMWAPDVQKKDGKYYLFFSANDAYPIGGKKEDRDPQEEPGLSKYGGIGVAVADAPEGPYRDLIGKPLIDRFWNGAQPIDQYVFAYQGEWYMVYGGWRKCNLVRLASDFKSLIPFDDGQLWHPFTPQEYTEGSVVFERKGIWYFMYSSGNWTDGSYCVKYSVAKTPFGPFDFKGCVLGSQEPIATGAGHHSVVRKPGTDEWYICYHRRPIPNLSPHHRVTCLDRMFFDANGDIRPIVMTK